MKRHLSFFILGVSLSASCLGAKDNGFGVRRPDCGSVDVVRVLETSKAANQARARIEKEFAATDRRLSQEAKNIRELRGREQHRALVERHFDAYEGPATPELLEMREKLEKREAAWRSAQEAFRENLRLARGRELDALMSRIKQAVVSLAEENELVAVFTTRDEVVVYAARGSNRLAPVCGPPPMPLTDAVMERMEHE